MCISIFLSTKFNEICKTNKKSTESLKQKIISYKNELKTAFKFIFKSHRLQAIMIFTVFFDGFLYSSYTLRESMLTEINISPQYFAIIISGLTIISGLFASLQNKIHQKFRNKSLTLIVCVYIPTFIFVGTISMLKINFAIKTILILLLYVIQYSMQSPYYILSEKYIKNFTKSEIRTKISSTFNLIKSFSQVFVGLIASFLLSIQTISNTFIILGVSFLLIMLVVLIYIKPRFGLKPEEYRKEDIKLKI